MWPGDVRYLSVPEKLLRTYFCLLDDGFCLKPAFLAVFMSVFFAKPLKIYKKKKVISHQQQMKSFIG